MVRSISPPRSERGFTLLEVLVAVAILGIALAAIIKTVSENTANAAYLREKTFAHWVAVNKLAELEVTDTFQTGRSSGKSSMGDREWPWQVEISETPNSEIHRVEIAVYSPEDEEAQLASLTGMLGDPQMKQAPKNPQPNQPGTTSGNSGTGDSTGNVGAPPPQGEGE